MEIRRLIVIRVPPNSQYTLPTLGFFSFFFFFLSFFLFFFCLFVLRFFFFFFFFGGGGLFFVGVFYGVVLCVCVCVGLLNNYYSFISMYTTCPGEPVLLLSTFSSILRHHALTSHTRRSKQVVRNVQNTRQIVSGILKMADLSFLQIIVPFTSALSSFESDRVSFTDNMENI